MQTALYLDHAAATPLDATVLAAMQPYFTTEFYNPSALYSPAEKVRIATEAARASIAAQLGVRPVEILFTAGATEANNLAVQGVMQQYPDRNVVVSAIEHDSVLETARLYPHRVARVNQQGMIDLDHLAAVIDDQTVLVSVMYANNEIGSIQPIRDVTAHVEGVRRDRRSRGIQLPIYVHTDAAQAGNYMDLQTSRLGVDMLSLNGGKIYGPKQTGILFVKSTVQLRPLIVGGGQERGLRSGTENVPGIIGFAQALLLAQTMRRSETRRLQALQQHFYSQLPQYLPTAILNGSLKQRLPNNLHITIPGSDNERLIFGLDEAGIMVAAGSACSASSDTPSHVLQALGLSDAAARSSLRLSMGRSTTMQQIDQVLRTLQTLTQP